MVCIDFNRNLVPAGECFLFTGTSDLFSLQASEEVKVLVCCLESPLAAIKKSHDAVQTCFHELCQSAIKTICQVQ